jgi:glycosyltransferase involved in cell wall biosynthesis
MVGLSIAICTYKRPLLLRRALLSVINQLPNLHFDCEIIVVDNNSGDNSCDICMDLAKRFGLEIGFINEFNRGISFVRNRALREVKYPYILFLDDDAWASTDWIISITNPLHNLQIHERPLCVVGPVKLVWEGNGKPNWFPKRYESLLCEYNFGPDSSFLSRKDYLLTTNALFHTETIIKLGGFNTDLGRIGDRTLGGEDNEIFQRFYRNNFRVWYQANALVFHPVPVERQSKSYLIDRLFWDGASQPLMNDESIDTLTIFRKILYESRSILILMLKYLIKRNTYTFENRLEISQRMGKVFMYFKLLKKNRSL